MKNLSFPLISVALFVGAVLFTADRPDTNASLQELARFNGEFVPGPQIRQTTYQQNIDHYSDDARAMSPRHWGGFQKGMREPVAPPVSANAFPNARPLQSNPTLAGPKQLDDGATSSPYGMAEFGRVQQPQQFYETTPIQPGSPGGGQPGYSTPIPPGGYPFFGGIPIGQDPPPIPPQSGWNVQSTVETLEPSNQGNEQSKPATDSDSPETSNDQTPESSDMSAAKQTPTQREESNEKWDSSMPQPKNQVNVPSNVDYHPGFAQVAGPVCDQCVRKFCGDGCDFQRQGRLLQHGGRGNRESSCGDSSACDCPYPILPQPEFNPNLGHRNAENTVRFGELSSLEQFDFEAKNEHFPPMREILKQAVYFADAQFGFVQPSFQGNTAITRTGPASGSSSAFDFDFDPMPRFRVGFESEYGPGLEIDYFQFDQDSDLATFTSDGIITGTTSLYQMGPNQWTSISATGAGEALNAKHSLEVQSIGASAFKALKFRRTQLVGHFGVQYVRIDHELDARLFDSGGTETGRLLGTSSLNAFGPRIGMDYIRPVGHTKLELIAAASGSVLFGNQDQNVSNSVSSQFSSIGSDEFLTIIDIFSGLQTRFMRGEKRNTFVRLGYITQSWFGGGTAIDPTGDLGFQGVTMAIGFNR